MVEISEQRERMIEVASEINPKKVETKKKNKSCFFILPLLGYASHWYYGLLNCYLGDTINKPDLLDELKIFIHLKIYDKKMLGANYFNQFYKLEDNSYMYIYDIPKKFIEDYNKFVKGKYSEMSEEAKEIICRQSGVKPIMNSIVYKVLYKTADQKKIIEDMIGERLPLSAEVYSVPDFNKEIYSELCISSNKDIIEEEESEREEI